MNDREADRVILRRGHGHIEDWNRYRDDRHPPERRVGSRGQCPRRAVIVSTLACRNVPRALRMVCAVPARLHLARAAVQIASGTQRWQHAQNRCEERDRESRNRLHDLSVTLAPVERSST